MDAADAVWNRAIADPAPDARSGDRALHAVLVLHGLAMSGGVLDAVTALSGERIAAASDGCRWLGLGAVADLIDSVQAEVRAGVLDDDDRADALEASADGAYHDAVPRDLVLVDAFRLRYARSPSDFAPLS